MKWEAWTAGVTRLDSYFEVVARRRFFGGLLAQTIGFYIFPECSLWV